MQAERCRLLERWLAEVVATPGLTSLRDPSKARAVLLDDALRAAPLVAGTRGPVIDVGSGGGSPGVPLAAALADRHFVLLEAERRKCAFLEPFAAELGNASVVWARAEEQPADTFGVALAKALAKPAVAVELCVPLVEPGGSVLLWVGASADVEHVDRVARLLGGELAGEPLSGILEIQKVDQTPRGFPRRPGMAKKRPLA